MIYLNSLVVMKAVRVCWWWIDGVSGEKRTEERVIGAKSNCRQIVGLDNGLDPTSLLPPSAQCVCVHTYFCVYTVPNLPFYSCEFHMQLICDAIFLSINADIPV